MNEKYFLVVFENGEEWKHEGVQPVPALTEARKRGTQTKCILYGCENPLGEFVPEKCWDANGYKDDSMLIVELLSRSANSRHPVLAGMAMYATKKIKEDNGA
jgi:hypothetical protein